MRIKVLLAALALAAASVGSAGAQTGATTPAGEAGVPTVTIINKAPAASAGAAPARPSEAARAQPSPEAPPVATAAPAEGHDAAPDAEASREAAAPASPPEPTLSISIDLTRQRMTVSERGEVRHTWAISSARYGYRTPTGTYQPTWMAKMWYSRQYDYAPMPHAIFFHKGVAIHGTTATRMLGRPASHGCVRLAPKNAATLFKLVTAHGKARTTVVVHGKPDHSGAQVAARERAPREAARRGQARYLPPNHARNGAPAGGYYAPRTRRYYAPPRPPRGLYNSYSYGYGF